MSDQIITKKFIQNVAKQESSAIEQAVKNALLYSVENAVCIIGDSIDFFLRKGEFASAYYLLGLKCISKIKHPYLDYSRVVTLCYCGKIDDAKNLLNCAINDYPSDQSLRDLNAVLDKGLNVKYLYE